MEQIFSVLLFFSYYKIMRALINNLLVNVQSFCLIIVMIILRKQLNTCKSKLLDGMFRILLSDIYIYIDVKLIIFVITVLDTLYM